MIIDFLIRNLEWFYLIALCLILFNALTYYYFLIPKLNPLVNIRNDLQVNLFYMGLINDNPPTGGNPRIEQMLDYALYLSGLDYSSRRLRPVMVTGGVLFIVSSVLGVLLMMVSEFEEPLFPFGVISIILSFINLMTLIFPPVICWSNRLYAAKLRRAAGRASAEYYLMKSEQDEAFNPDVSSEDDGTTGNQTGV